VPASTTSPLSLTKALEYSVDHDVQRRRRGVTTVITVTRKTVFWIQGFGDGVASRCYRDGRTISLHLVSLLGVGSPPLGESIGRGDQYCIGYLKGDRTKALIRLTFENLAFLTLQTIRMLMP